MPTRAGCNPEPRPPPAGGRLALRGQPGVTLPVHSLPPPPGWAASQPWAPSWRRRCRTQALQGPAVTRLPTRPHTSGRSDQGCAVPRGSWGCSRRPGCPQMPRGKAGTGSGAGWGERGAEGRHGQAPPSPLPTNQAAGAARGTATASPVTRCQACSRRPERPILQGPPLPATRPAQGPRAFDRGPVPAAWGVSAGRAASWAGTRTSKRRPGAAGFSRARF